MRKQQQLTLAIASLMMLGALSMSVSLYTSQGQTSSAYFFPEFGFDSLTNPPIAMIMSDSMEPTLKRGDIAYIHKVDPETVKEGDVVAVWVPTKYRIAPYNMPPRIIHRVTEIKELSGTTYLETKGDAENKEDIFRTPLRNAIGVYSGLKIPFFGLIFLFVRTTIGMTYLAIVVITLFLLKFVPYQVNKEKEGAGKINEIYERTTQFQGSIQDLSSAVSEYAYHLKTHTAILQNLNSSTGELKEVTRELASKVNKRIDVNADGSEPELKSELKEPETTKLQPQPQPESFEEEKEKDKVKEWGLQKGVVGEEWAKEAEKEKGENKDDWIYNLKEEEEAVEETEMDIVLKKEMEGVGDMSTGEILELGRTVLGEIAGERR